MAITRGLRILWCTPQAAELCDGVGCAEPDGDLRLPEVLRAWICGLVNNPDPRQIGTSHPVGTDSNGLRFIYVGRTGTDEFLFRIADTRSPPEEEILQAQLSLTRREAEVLLWISQGKSNRDIGDILGVSPRTVNKHLEQIFAKLGVENRTAAAALAVRTIVSSSSG